MPIRIFPYSSRVWTEFGVSIGMTRQSERVGEHRGNSTVSANKHRLDGWKEIAASLGKDERTAKRWAAERGLPVHRAPGDRRSSVYAWSQELQDWLRPQPAVAVPAVLSQDPIAEKSTAPKTWPILAVLGTSLLALVLATAALSTARQPAPEATVSSSAAALPQAVRQIYLDANYLWQKRTPEALQNAERLLLQVADMAPGFAGAQADLATVYNLMVEISVLPAEEGYGRSEAAAHRTIALDPDNAQAYTVLGDLEFYWHHDFAAGLRMFERAVSLAPGNALARQWYASALMSSGRYTEAAVEIERARQLEPASRSIQVSAAMIALGLGEIERARQMLLQLVANEPDYRSPHRFLSFIALERQDRSGYLVALANRYRIIGDAYGRSIVDVGMDHIGAPSDEAFGQAMLAAAQRDAAKAEPYFLAQLLALAGRWDEAARQLGDTPTRQAFYYSLDPAFKAARADPAFRRQIAALGLPIVP